MATYVSPRHHLLTLVTVDRSYGKGHGSSVLLGRPEPGGGWLKEAALTMR